MFDLNGIGHYLGSGWLQVSVANAITVGLMLVTFIAAVLVPFPGSGAAEGPTAGTDPGQRLDPGRQP